MESVNEVSTGTVLPAARNTQSDGAVTLTGSQNTGTADAVAVKTDTVVSDTVLGNVKSLLIIAGHDVESVWDDAVAFARKAADETALTSTLEKILSVAGHDVSAVIEDAFSFASHHGQ